MLLTLTHFKAGDQNFDPRKISPKIKKCIPCTPAFQTNIGPRGQNSAVFELQEPNFCCIVFFALSPYEFAEQEQPNVLGVEYEKASLSGE